MSSKFYITTTLPYVNAEPHIGFGAEIIRADVIARYRRLLGDGVFFNTGTDEHGLKIFREAEASGETPQAYVDRYAATFDALKQALDLSYDRFIRTTDPGHIAAVQEFWKRCDAAADIYKKVYQVKYCVGCELEKTESELVNGHCPLHPNKDLELIDEENYFFRFSKYQDALLKHYEAHPDFVIPAHRLTEIKNFVAGGLQDFSISRLKTKMPWGVPVPGDDAQVMYVWFDALVNYISTLGWPESGNFETFWPGMQVAGKDNLRQQSAMWQAMLLSAGLPPSKQVLIFGFITANGQKMSKSVGNVVSPIDLVARYGTDAARYLILSELQAYEDSDYSQAKFDARYTADLANGLGNLVARTSNLIERGGYSIALSPEPDASLSDPFHQAIDSFDFPGALAILWNRLREQDEQMSAQTPWKLPVGDEQREILAPIAQRIYAVAQLLQPFMPATAGKIIGQFGAEKIVKGDSLFPRI